MGLGWGAGLQGFGQRAARLPVIKACMCMRIAVCAYIWAPAMIRKAAAMPKRATTIPCRRVVVGMGVLEVRGSGDGGAW